MLMVSWVWFSGSYFWQQKFDTFILRCSLLSSSSILFFAWIMNIKWLLEGRTEGERWLFYCSCGTAHTVTRKRFGFVLVVCEQHKLIDSNWWKNERVAFDYRLAWSLTHLYVLLSIRLWSSLSLIANQSALFDEISFGSDVFFFSLAKVIQIKFWILKIQENWKEEKGFKGKVSVESITKSLVSLSILILEIKRFFFFLFSSLIIRQYSVFFRSAFYFSLKFFEIYFISYFFGFNIEIFFKKWSNSI